MVIRGKTVGYTIIGSLLVAFLLLAAKGFWLYLVEGKKYFIRTDPLAAFASIGVLCLIGVAVYAMFISFLRYLIEENPTVQIGKNKRK